MIGAVYLSGGFDEAGQVVHRLFDPLMAAAAGLGAGLDWKTSLQELSAAHGLGVPEYVIDDDGPDHDKTFTAQVRVGDERYGHGTGRSKKEAEQQAAETACREIVAAARRPRHRRPTTDARTAEPPGPCPSSPRSRSSAAASRPHVVGRTDRCRSRSLHPRPVRRHLAGADAFAAVLAGAASLAARRRGKYLWLPLDERRRPARRTWA